jgi:predicted metal-dependent HD superfamily phosphohydrolase
MSVVGLQRWGKLCESVGAGQDAPACFHRLTAAYSEPHRHYHNLRHIAECQNEFDAVRDRLVSPAAIELAIWFHDAVYDTKASDNEEKSAEWAREFLSAADVEDSIVQQVSNLILATKHHDTRLDPGAPALVDIDLSILGQPERRFWEYETQIRAEYAWVDPALFSQKRAEILEAFLKRARIYSTDWFFERYERPARQNLQASIERLRA